MEELFKKFVDEKGIRPQIKKKRMDYLDTQIKQHIFSWQQIVHNLISKFNSEKSKFIGDFSLQNAIERHIQANANQITKQEAEEIFVKEWV